MLVQRFCLIVVVASISFLGFPGVAKADMEGRMPFTNVQYSSAGIDNSGRIRIDAFQDKDGLYKLKVFAFGRTRTVTKARLTAINGYVFNAIGISYSRGYTNTGGRSVYVLLYQLFASGPTLAAVVTITEHDAVRIDIIKPTSQ